MTCVLEVQMVMEKLRTPNSLFRPVIFDPPDKSLSPLVDLMKDCWDEVSAPVPLDDPMQYACRQEAGYPVKDASCIEQQRQYGADASCHACGTRYDLNSQQIAYARCQDFQELAYHQPHPLQCGISGPEASSLKSFNFPFILAWSCV